tara:strand:- start:1995 stop:2870 length:876 start_codon:yes stop_codon:yes gene_type:complete
MSIAAGITASSIGDNLDHFGSDCFAAFSVRRFNSYSGVAMRIRRESDNNEADVSFNDLGEISLDSTVSNFSSSSSATNLGQFVAASGYTDADSLGSADSARTVTWKDQSGNSRDITQATTTRQPLLVSSGTMVTENGKVSLDFYSDRLEWDDATVQSQPRTFLAVANSDSHTSSDYMFDSDDNNNRFLFIHNSSVRTMYSTAFAGTSSADANQNLWFGLFNGSSSELAINGTNETGLDPGSGGIDGLCVGARYNGGNSWDGDIQEFIHWGADMSANRSNIEGNTNKYFGIY